MGKNGVINIHQSPLTAEELPDLMNLGTGIRDSNPAVILDL
jgi:hypothetical protein